jgi:hypothetical protein
MNLPSAITSAYPTAASVTISQICVPGSDWQNASEQLTAKQVAKLREQGVTSVSLTILDADGFCLARFADFRLDELQFEVEVDYHEIVRVRKINVHAIERAIDCPIEEVEDFYGDEEYSVGLRAGKSWIEGPRGLLCYLANVADEQAETNIREVGYDSDWDPATPDWMREKALQSMIDAVYRASKQIGEQC